MINALIGKSVGLLRKDLNILAVNSNLVNKKNFVKNVLPGKTSDFFSTKIWWVVMKETVFPITEVIKRDKTIAVFDRERISNAIFKALKASNKEDYSLAEQLSLLVCKQLPKYYPGKKKVSIEEIQDIVEIVLIEENLAQTAKAYILYRKEHTDLREKQKQLLNGKTTKMDLSLNSLTVITKRYLKKDENGEVIENPEEMFERVAKAIALIEKNYGKNEKEIEEYYNKFLEIMISTEFSPAGRTLTNAGAETKLVNNCIVLHPKDSMDEIFQTLKEAAILQQLGAGLGFPFHLLRPAGSKCRRTQGMSGGPVSFLKIYNEAFGVIKQQKRHGANMAVMRVDHPDILEFIHCKRKEGEMANFNISIGMTDEFMEKVISNDAEPYYCQFNGIKIKPRRIYRDEKFHIKDIREENMTAKQIFNEIVESAWSNGEPGIVFLDEVNRTNPVPGLGSIEATNPCGEQALHDGDVCNLGSINLDRFVKNKKIDFKRLKEVTKIAIRLLDNVIDLTSYPVERVEKTFRGNRRIGLGIMGFADMLFQLGIPYNSEEGIKTAEEVAKCIQETSHKTSQELAMEKGVFPNYDLSVYKKKGIKMRNAAVTTIAPTGTISMMFDVSSGIEPHFALTYFKTGIMDGMTLRYVNKHFEKTMKDNGLMDDELLSKVAETGSIQNLKEIPEEIRKVFCVAMDIQPYWHMRMQAAFQKHIDNSISKTVNFPNEATLEEVEQAYLYAYKMGCKGMTIYRDGSRQLQVLTVKNPELEKQPTIDISIASTQNQSGQLALKQTGIKGKDICPKCDSKMEMKEGCATCPNCGLSLCSL